MSLTTTIIFIVIAVLIIWVITAYNRLVSLRNHAKEAWADIDVQMKRRYDLIPNLIETVKGYAAHEKTVLEDVTKARTTAMSATAPADKVKAENALAGTLKSLFAVAENYPQLKANENFLELQRELSDTENKIQAARRFYNMTVMALNTAEQKFPMNLMAGPMGFKPMDLFELAASDAAAKEPVKVQF